jgi:hypothetical protein
MSIGSTQCTRLSSIPTHSWLEGTVARLDQAKLQPNADAKGDGLRPRRTR